MPAGPRERRVSIHVAGIDNSARIQQELDGLFIAESGGAMKRSLAFGSAVSHESTSFNGFFRYTIRIRAMREQDLHHYIVAEAVGGTQCRVQRGFSRIGQRIIHVCAPFEQEFTKPPMSVETSSNETDVFSQRSQRFAIGEQEFYCAHIPVIRAPLDQRNSACIRGVSSMAFSKVFEYQVRAAVYDFFKHTHRSCLSHKVFAIARFPHLCASGALQLTPRGTRVPHN